MMQVITGDIIDSVKLIPEERNTLIATMEELESNSKGRYDFFIRGDSFQVLMKEDALLETLKIKYLLKIRTGLAARVSIGIGPVTHLDSRLSNSDGPAFWLSGQGLDAMKAEKALLSIHTENEEKNKEWFLHTHTLDYLEKTNTLNQTEVHYWSLLNKTQQEIAEIIGITQSSVNRRIKNSGWHLIEKIVAHFSETL